MRPRRGGGVEASIPSINDECVDAGWSGASLTGANAAEQIKNQPPPPGRDAPVASRDRVISVGRIGFPTRRSQSVAPSSLRGDGLQAKEGLVRVLHSVRPQAGTAIDVVDIADDDPR